VSRLTKIVALTVVALWGLAAMHCKLEALAGLDFLESCCVSDDAAASSQKDCDDGVCCAVEEASYRAEEQTASAPQPLLVLALTPSIIDAPLPELQAHFYFSPRPPPELRKVWQFYQRAALPQRAPSGAS
jgi:hypothetical protein